MQYILLVLVYFVGIIHYSLSHEHKRSDYLENTTITLFVEKIV
jgi:hypothetical protein